jgi:hypothetical protein
MIAAGTGNNRPAGISLDPGYISDNAEINQGKTSHPASDKKAACPKTGTQLICSGLFGNPAVLAKAVPSL